ncbi:MAG: 2-keto-4-pentenoate hydratase [Beijerinckiaceae bacterium]
MSMADGAVQAAAATILAALDARRQIAPLTSAPGGLSIADSYRVSRAVTQLRKARGERPVGRKIGFTNRTIWDEYGVHHPIDGPMYENTVGFRQGPVVGYALSRFVEPRIEPEIVLGLASAPRPDMDDERLMGCIGWIAHGFEIVQSLYPGWVFKGADCIAAFGLHGALICGPRLEIAGEERGRALLALASFDIRLSRNGALVDTGKAENVLGGPVLALLHLVRAIAADPEAAPLRAGDIVTTGTVTRAFPVQPGERWSTSVTGLDLPGMDVAFT